VVRAVVRFLRLELNDVRGVDHCTVDFADSGVTLVTGQNETGKSTLLEAIDLLFDAPANSRRRNVLEIQPKGRDVGPEVTLEFTVGSNELRYRKRWCVREFAELRITRPDGTTRNLTGKEAHEQARALLEEEIDLALWRAVRLAQGDALKLPAFGEVPSLATALDVIAGGSGPVDDTLRDRAEAERARYWSKQWARPANELLEARKKAEEAEANLASARAAYEATLAASREIEEKEDELAQLGPRLAELDRLAAEAAEELREREQAEQLMHNATQLQRTAESDLTRATAATEERRRLRERAERLATDLASATETATEAERAALGASEAREAAKEARTAAENDLRRQRERRQLLDRQLRSLDLEDKVARLASRIEQAEEAETDRHAAETELNTLRVDEATLEEIRTAQSATDLARGRHEAASPRIRFEADQRLALDVDGESLAVEPGRPWERVATTTITVGIPGVGRISVSPGATETRSDLERAEATLRAAFDAAGVGSLAEAIEAASRRRHLEERLRLAEERRRGALGDAPDVETLRDQRHRDLAELETLAAGRPNDATVPTTRDALLRERQAVETELLRAERALEVANEHADRAESDALAAERHYSECLGRLRNQESERAMAAGELAAERTRVSDEDLEAARLAAAARLAEANAGAEDAARRLEVTDPLAREKAEQAAAAREEVGRRQIVLQSELESDRRHLADRLGGGADLVAERERDAEIARAKRERVERQASAARLLAETLSRQRGEAQRRYRQPLEEQLRSWGRTVFDEPVDAIALDEELRITGVTRQGITLPVDDLSAGTREQLGLLLRLAAAVLASPGEGVPVVLDDALGYSDRTRRNGVLAVLRQAARRLQVVILTAEADRFRGLAARVIELDRRPRALRAHAGPPPAESWVGPGPRSNDAAPTDAPEADGHDPHRFDADRFADGGTHEANGGSRRHPDDVAERILACLRGAGSPLGRREICDRGQIDERAWPTAIRALVGQRLVIQEGERRGARYRLP